MSIATEISRIKAAKESLKLAINARGGTLTTELLDDYAAAVTALPSGGSDIDLSGVTVSADKLLAGVVAVDASGSKVIGTIPEVTASRSENSVTVPAGFHPEAKNFSIAGGGETVTFGYIDEWGKFQALDLSAIPPVASGGAVETDLVAFALPSDIEDSLEVAAYNVYIDTTIADTLTKDTDKWCLENINGNLLLSDDSISKRTMYGGVRADGTEFRLIWYPSSDCYVLLRGYTDIICELSGKKKPSDLYGTYTALDGTTVIISKYEA